MNAGCNELWFGNARQDGDRLIVDLEYTSEVGCTPERLDQDDWLARVLTRSRPGSARVAEPLRVTLVQYVDAVARRRFGPTLMVRIPIRTTDHDGPATMMTGQP